MSNPTQRFTRAQAPARGNEAVPAVVRLILPDEAQEQRIPRILAEVHLGGGIRASFTIARKRGPKGHLAGC